MLFVHLHERKTLAFLYVRGNAGPGKGSDPVEAIKKTMTKTIIRRQLWPLG